MLLDGMVRKIMIAWVMGVDIQFCFGVGESVKQFIWLLL